MNRKMQVWIMIRAYDEYGNIIDLVEWENYIRATAIDDFLEAIDRADREEPLILDMYEIEQIAEHLKGGGENE